MLNNIPIGKYNILYEKIDDCSTIISYASISMAGGMTFGVYGAVIGLGVSILEDFLVHNNYIKDKSFSQVFIGSALCYNVYPSWITGLIGGAGSFFIVQNKLENYSDNFSNTIINAAVGAKFNGILGLTTGIMVSFIDQIILHHNFTNKLYFSHALFGATSVSLVFGKTILSISAGVALGLLVVHNFDLKTTWIFQPKELTQELYSIYSKILPQDQLNTYISDYCIILLSSQIIMYQLRIILLKHQQSSMYQFEHMDNSESDSINKLVSVVIKYSLFVLPYAVTEFVTDIVNSFFSTKLYISIDDNLKQILFYNETALKLSFNKSHTVLIDNLKLDSKIISRDGSKLVIDYITKSINGVYGGGVLIVKAPEVLFYSIVYNKITEGISNILAELQNKYEVIIKEQESKIFSLFRHNMDNIKIITETRGIQYSYEQIQSENRILRENELIKDQLVILMVTWKSFESITNFISSYFLIGYKVGKGTINFDDRINMHYSCLQISGLLAWNGEKSQEIKAVYQSIERLNKFLNKAIADYEQSLDNIDRIIRTKLIDGNKLVISKLGIIIATKKLIHIDYLELEFGSSYVINGPSGSGKSSLVSKIAGIINNNIGGEGKIYYPNDPKIILISQQIYFPLYKSLKDIIFYPIQVDDQKIFLLEELLQQVDLPYALDQVEDWINVLSGGQKQKIRIISAIIQEPNILILDEVFNGLDKNSIKLMQSIITKNLENIILISVDHNALENNKTGFYSHFLDLVEGNLIDQNNNIEDVECLNDKPYEECIGCNDLCYDN